jgi:ketosteroid isomerase-like protein
MHKLRPLLNQPSIVGLLTGLLILCGWGFLPTLLERPTLVLAVMVLLAALAGFVSTWISSRSSLRSDLLTRRGATAGVWAALTAEVCFVLMARTMPGASPLRALITAGACVMPAALAGTIAAGCAVAFFRRKGIPEGAEPPPELSAAGRWVARCLLGLGIGAGLLAPLFPTAPLRSAVMAKAEVTRFRYDMPEALKTAPPSAWKVATTRSLGSMLEYGLALSKDQKFLAGLANPQSIVIHELDTDAVQSLPMMPHPVSAVSFSPDGLRLFVVMEAATDGPRRLAVVERGSGRIIPLPTPKKHAVPKGAMDWVKPEWVGFDVGGLVWTLNLSSLEFEMDALTAEETERVRRGWSLTLPKNDRWAFNMESRIVTAETPETEGTTPDWVLPTTSVLTLRDEQRATFRAFPEISFSMNRDAPLFGVADGSKIIRLDGGMAEVIYFETRPLPPLRWKIAMPHGPEKLRDQEAVAGALAQGQLGLMLYPPLINPLTGKTVGPDRENPKAQLGVLNWSGTEAEVWVYFDSYSFASGDVLADMCFPGNSNLTLLSFPQPNRWWTVAPEPTTDAADVSKLPTPDDLKKRKNEAKDKARAAEQAAKAEPRNTPPPTTAAPASKAPDAAPMPQPSPTSSPSEKSLPGSRDDVIASMGERTNRQLIEGGVTPQQLLEAEVANFVFAHHQKASAGDIPGMVSDYAATVHFFGKAGITREAIAKEETDYHRNLKTHSEVLEGLVEFPSISATRAIAAYELKVSSLDNKGKTTDLTIKVRLGLERQADGWRITSHSSESKK